MYAKLQNHMNVQESRKALVKTVQSVVAKTTILMVDGSLYKKGALVSMIKKGFLDGRYAMITRHIDDRSVSSIDIVTARNVPEFDSHYYHKIG